MKKILQYIRNHGAWAFAFMIAMASPILGPLAALSPLYPLAFAAGTAVVLLTRNLRISLPMAFLVLACAASIILANPLPIFQPWVRLCYSLLVFIVLSPLLSSPTLEEFRIRLYEWVMRLSVFIGVASFFCYFAGINYMTTFYKASPGTAGLFGGLTVQSMLLGPMAGVGFIHLLYRTLKEMMTYGTLSLPRLFMMLACLCSVLLSASRGAFLATAAASGYLFFMFLKDKPHQLLKTGVCLLLVSGAAYPLMGHFASGMISKQEANEKSGGTFSSREILWDDRKREFLDSPVYGVGFASQRIVSYAVSLRTGVIEPGTSYGAIFAMTGLLGGLPFMYILLTNILKRPFPRRYGAPVSPAQATLVFFSLHMVTEGYAFAAGASLGAVFWCSLGAAAAYRHQIHTHPLEIP